MSSSRQRRRLQRVLELADVRVDGARAWDLQVRDDRLYRRLAARGMVGLGEAYVNGWWECDAIDQLADRCLRADLPARIGITPVATWQVLKEKLLNVQRPSMAWANVRSHYDRGNDLFERMLDRRLTYSCAFWERARNLDEAQEAKLDRVCRKLMIEPHMRVLDIGCGWGSFVGFAAERYGCHVTGITLSRRQVEYARARYADLPVEFRLQDYREIDEPFDRVVSIGMFEHVGQKNHRRFMQSVRRCMRCDGLCLLHFFATQRSWPNLRDTEALWVSRNIFPGFVTPSLAQVGRALEGELVVEDMENFGADYDPTLMSWHENFTRAWSELRAAYGERFERTWRFYLLLCAGAFRSRKYQLWQIVLSRTNGAEGVWRRRAASVLDEAPPLVTSRPVAVRDRTLTTDAP